MSTPVKSAERVLMVLEALTESPEGLTLAELQQQLQIPRSSAHGIVMTMVQRGFLAQDRESRRFQVGIRLWQAGRRYVSAMSLERVALPYMGELRDQINETVQLAVLDGSDNVYIAKVDADQQLRLASQVGVRLPAYATGIGKAILSQLSDEEIRERFAGVTFVPWTPTTLPDVEHLLAECAAIRDRGYATDKGEYTLGVFCVAYPIVTSGEHGLAGVSVSIPEARRSDALIDRALDGLQKTAERISQRLG